MKTPYLVDVPVALIFFNRPEVFEKVFECVKRSRPSTLFLIQDGARANRPTDSEKIKQCREICSHVDWECKVYEDFATENLGCGKRVFTGITNAFKIVDRLVIIEDDILFSNSFLPFCQELLEKYKDDERINQISGMNHFGEYTDCDSSYFFSRGGAIWGWATWRRVWDDIKWELPEAENDYISKTLVRNKYPRNYGLYLDKRAKELRAQIMNSKNPSFWSFHFLYYSYLQSRFNIVPKYNMISNIGLTADSSHATDSIKRVTKNIQKVFFAEMKEIAFPLSHPLAVLEDRYYKVIQDDFMYPRGIKKVLMYLDLAYRRIRYR